MASGSVEIEGTESTAEGAVVRVLLAERTVRIGEPVRVSLRLENSTRSEILLKERYWDPTAGHLAVEVWFEDGFPCPRIGPQVSGGAKRRRTLKPGSHGDLSPDLRAVVAMNGVGVYRCRLGFDPSGRWGLGGGTSWGREVIQVAIDPADKTVIDAWLHDLGPDGDWRNRDALDLSAMSDCGDPSLLPGFQALGARLNEMTRSGDPPPEDLLRETEFAPERIRVLQLARRGEWSELRDQVEATGPSEANRQRFRRFLRVAYALRLLREK